MAQSVIGDLAVRVGANTEDFVKGLNKAKGSLANFGADVRSGTVDLAKYAAAATAAAGAIGGALLVSAADAAREVQNLANISNTSVEDFQKLAFGAKSVGIQQDKLADIFKDTNDKITDFIHNGAGPMADFFEKIGPKVGVTAEQFRKLSGPQSLQLYVDSLQKAGLNHEEMTFYMEALASDATMLLPLLKDNGAAMLEQAKAADELGLAMSEIDVTALTTMKGQMDQVQGVMSSLADQTSAKLAPVINALGQEFIATIKDMGGVGPASETMANNIIGAAGFAIDAVEGIKRAFEVVGKGIALVGLGISETILSMAEFMVNRPVEAANELIDVLNELPGIDLTPIGLTQFGKDVKDQVQLVRGAIDEGMTDIHETMMEPMPSKQFEKFVHNAIEANKAVAEVNKVARQEEKEAQIAHVEEVGQVVAETEAEQAAARLEKKRADKELEKQQKLDALNEMALMDYLFGQQQLETAEQQMAARQQAMASMFSNLESLMNSKSRKMFEIGKAAAMSNTVIQTIKSAQDSYAALAGIPVVGPALGVAAAGAAIAAGAVRLQAINARSFNKGSGGLSSAGGGAASGGGIPSGVSGGGVTSGQNIFVQGLNPGDLFTGEQVVDLINNAQENGARLVIL